MIEGVPSAYFCSLNQEINLGGGTTVPVILNVKEIFIDDKIILDREKLNITFKPVVRIGKAYAFLGENVDAPTIS